MQDIEGRAAVVTGAGSGIGRGIAHALAAEGARIAVTDVDVAAAERVARELNDLGATARAYALDVTDQDAVEALAEVVENDLGPVTILCNNAGVIIESTIADATLADWQWILSVNLYGQIHGVRAFVPRMRAHGQGGHVVNTASMAGIAPRLDTRLGLYSASKAASVAFSDTLRQELSEEGIGVSTLVPGPVQTRIWEAARNRPAHLGPGRMIPVPDRHTTAPEPMLVGRLVVRGIQENRAFIYVSEDSRARIEERVARLLADIDRGDAR